MPVADYDQPLDWIMTERGVIEPKRISECAFCFSAMSSAGRAARPCAANCRNCATAMRPISWSSMARTPPHGFGITEDIFDGLIDAGADVVTLGNHAFDQREALVFIERAAAIAASGQLSAGCARPRRRTVFTHEGPAGAGDQRHGPGDDRAAAR